MKIKEFAQRVGISQQAVYKQLNNRLKDYVTVIDGKKWIDKRALELYEPKVNSTNCSTDNQPMNNQLNDKLIEMLRKELEEKGQQLHEKDKQIAELQKLLDQSQKLNAMDKQKILELEDKQASEEQNKKNEEPVKKKWWQKIF